MALQACGDDGDAGAAGTGDKVEGTLTVTMNPTLKNAMTTLIPEFEKAHPGVTVKPTYLQVDQLDAQVRTQLLAKNGPDVLNVSPGRTGSYLAVGTLAPDGVLEELTGGLLANFQGLDDATANNYSWDGKRYVPPSHVTPSVLTYNNDALKALGLTPPTTFDELLNICAEAKKAGKVGVAYAAGDPGSNRNFVLGFIGSDVLGPDPEWFAKREKNEVTFVESAWRKTFERLPRMIDAGCFKDGSEGVTDVAATQGEVAKGDALLYIGVVQYAAVIKSLNTSADIGITAVPGDSVDSTYVTWLPGNPFAINADAKNPATARAFLEFITGDGSAKLAELTGTVTIQNWVSAQLPERLTGLQPVVAAKRTAVSPLQQFRDQDDINAWAKGLTGIFTGQKTVDQILADMDAGY